MQKGAATLLSSTQRIASLSVVTIDTIASFAVPLGPTTSSSIHLRCRTSKTPPTLKTPDQGIENKWMQHELEADPNGKVCMVKKVPNTIRFKDGSRKSDLVLCKGSYGKTRRTRVS